MVITTLDARVASEKAAELQSIFNEAIHQLDAGITQTFLVRDLREPDRWQIMTVWESREALETMRQSGETPRGVVMFKAVGAEPKLTIFEVAAHASA